MKTLIVIMLFVAAMGLSAEPISKDLIKSLKDDLNTKVTKYNIIKISPKVKASFISQNKKGISDLIDIIKNDVNIKNIKYNKLDKDNIFKKK